MPPVARRTGKVVYSVATAAIAIAVVLHAPWSGYTTQTMPEKVDTLTLLRECPRIGETSSPETTQAQLLGRFADNLACASRLKPVPLPINITRWRSNEPLAHSFSRLRNVAAGALLVMLAAFALTRALDWALAGADTPQVKGGRRSR